MRLGLGARLFCLCGSLTLASCGGGGGSSAAPGPPVSSTTAPATLSIVVPVGARMGFGRKRRPLFVSGATLSASIAANGNPVRGADLSPRGPGCTQNTTSAYTCAITFDLPLGPTTIAVSTFDGPLSNGQPTGTLLAQAQVTQTIVAGQSNPIVMTLLGVPKAVKLQLDQATIPVGSATTVKLTATVLDPDGYTITSDPYLTPVTVASDDASGQVSIDKNTLANPTDVITVRYSGKLLQKPVTFSVTSPVQAYPPGSTAMLVADPFTRFGPTTYPNIQAIAAGPDGNVWFTECGILAGAMCKLGKVVPSTGAMTEFPDVRYAKGLVAGPDGNVWFTEANHNFIGRITPSGVVTEFAIPSGAPGNGADAGPIVVGPDNNIWFAEGDRIGVATLGGAITEYRIGGLFRPSSLVVGTDGALWFSEGQQIGRITTAGVVTQFLVDNSGFHSAGPLVFGPSNVMYFSATYPGPGPIWSMTTGGAVNQASLIPAGASFYPVLGTGPGGTMWGQGSVNDPFGFAAGGGVASVGFSGAWTLYLAAAPTPFGSTVGISRGAFGPDGNLWFVNGQGLVRFRIAL